MSTLTLVGFYYKDSGRSAIGLTVEVWRGTILQAAEVTNSAGIAGTFHVGDRLNLRRGEHRFSFEATVTEAPTAEGIRFGIEPEQWPETLTKFRELLCAEPEAGRSLRLIITDAANRVLESLGIEGDIDQITVPARVAERTNKENPLIVVGALLPSMAISRLFTIASGEDKYCSKTNNATERERLHGVKTGIHHILLWLRRRQHPLKPGYFLRWQQTQLDGRETVQDWFAEPSLDEYSGLLLAISWTLKLVPYYNCGLPNSWESAVQNELSKMMSDVSAYLKSTDGWLVRPGKNDLTARGPHLVVNAYPIALALNPRGNWQGFKNEYPFELSDFTKDMIENSAKSLESIESAAYAGVKLYVCEGQNVAVKWKSESDSLDHYLFNSIDWLVADIDNDNRAELIQLKRSGGNLGLVVYGWDAGSSKPSLKPRWWTPDIGQDYRALSWLVGDVDRDGMNEILQPWANGNKLGLFVYGWDGTKMRIKWATSDIGQGPWALSWLAADVDGDGKCELLQPWRNSDKLGLLVYGWDGTQMGTKWGTADIGQGPGALAWLVGDVNGDGKAELLQPWKNFNRLGLIIYAWDGAKMATLQGSNDIGDQTDTLKWLIGDIDADGMDELIQICSNGLLTALNIFGWDGIGMRKKWGISDLGVNPTKHWKLEDLDGDGKAELIRIGNRRVLNLSVFRWNGSEMVLDCKNDNMGKTSQSHPWLCADIDGDDKVELIEISGRGGRGSKLFEWYKGSVGLAQTIQSVDENTETAKWAGLVTSAFGVASGFLDFLFVGAAVTLGAHVAEDKVVKMTDRDIWSLAGQALGAPYAVDAGGYNTAIFDRFSLAAFWTADSFNLSAFSMRASRPIGGDANGFHTFGIACRLWMGVKFKSDEVEKFVHALSVDIDALIPNDGSLPSAGRAEIEGIIMGWSMLALALDLDPQIDWEKCVRPRNDFDAPTEIHAPDLPRFGFVLKTFVANETRERGDYYIGEEPYFWFIPVIISEGEDNFNYRILGSHQESFRRVQAGQERPVYRTISWEVGEDEHKPHLLLICVAWEADFTSFEMKAEALRSVVESIESELKKLLAASRPVTEMAHRIEAMLNWQLPHYYANPEAQPGYRQSDDDFIGAAVLQMSSSQEVNSQVVDHKIRLRRQPKPRPLFTDVTLSVALSFSRLGWPERRSASAW